MGEGRSPRRGKVSVIQGGHDLGALSTTVPTVNNSVLHTYRFGKRVDLTCSYHNLKKKKEISPMAFFKKIKS